MPYVLIPDRAKTIRRPMAFRALSALSIFLLLACGGSNQAAVKTETPLPIAETGGTPSAEASATPAKDPTKAYVHVIALSDFHGWILPLEPRGFPRYYGGIANIAGMIEHREKLPREERLLVDNDRHILAT